VVYRGPGGKAVAIWVALLHWFRSVGSADYRLPRTRVQFSAPVPAAALAAEDADLIERLASQGRVRMHSH